MPEIIERKITSKQYQEIINEFGHEHVRYMDHSGIILYLILHPEKINELKGAKPVALELNQPRDSSDASYGKDIHDRGRRRPRIDLVFKKEPNNYYLVEVIDSDKIKNHEKEKVKKYEESYKMNLGTGINVLSIIVYKEEIIV